MWCASVTACWCQVSCPWKVSWPSLWWWPNGNMIEDYHGLVNLEGTSLFFQWLNFVDVCQWNSHPQSICPNRLIVCVLHRELGYQWRRNQGKSLPSQNLNCRCGVRQEEAESNEVLDTSGPSTLILNTGWPNWVPVKGLLMDSRSPLWNGDIWESSESRNPYHLHGGSVTTECLMNEKGDRGCVVVVGEEEQWCWGLWRSGQSLILQGKAWLMLHEVTH